MLYNPASGTADSDTLKEYCGVFGVLDTESTCLGNQLYYGLYALQHRGQESCGMAVFDNLQLKLHKQMGLVNQVFHESLLKNMTGQVGIGHTRYSTTGDSALSNAQPVVTRTPIGALTLAHNGNLFNLEKLDAFLKENNFYRYGNSDSHLVALLINYHMGQGKTLEEATVTALNTVEGAFSIVLATGNTLIAARDRNGLRPLCLGEIKRQNGQNAIVLASESCALDIIGAEFIRDIEPGEVFIAKLDGKTSSQYLEGTRQDNLCIFEMVYFARPDSMINKSSIYNYRLGLGKRLAKISPDIDADFVIPVPDSGNVAAVGYSQASGIPYAEGLIKNRYVGRTFINPSQELREQGIKLKLNPLTDVLKGKRVVVVDDSIVRGNTSRKIVKMLKDSGVKEVHLRISSAQVKHPCFYGIDMSQESELIANKMDVEELRRWLDVSSLVYLSPQDMKDVANMQSACSACFDNAYPAGKPGSNNSQECIPC